MLVTISDVGRSSSFKSSSDDCSEATALHKLLFVSSSRLGNPSTSLMMISRSSSSSRSSTIVRLYMRLSGTAKIQLDNNNGVRDEYNINGRTNRSEFGDRKRLIKETVHAHACQTSICTDCKSVSITKKEKTTSTNTLAGNGRLTTVSERASQLKAGKHRFHEHFDNAVAARYTSIMTMTNRTRYDVVPTN